MLPKVRAGLAVLGVLPKFMFDMRGRAMRRVLAMQLYGAVAVLAADLACAQLYRIRDWDYLPIPNALVAASD